MQRIIIVGATGVGKTTLAKALAHKLALPCIELDALKWLPDWKARDQAEMRALLEAHRAAGAWIIDGNHGFLRDVTWAQADTLIWLDYPLWLSQWRLFWRSIRRVLSGERLWNGNRETFHQQFLSRQSLLVMAVTGWRWQQAQYPKLIQQPEYAHLNILRLKSPRETERWLQSVGSDKSDQSHDLSKGAGRDITKPSEQFMSLLKSIKSDCAWEHIPYDKISDLAKLCGQPEIDHLIAELDRLKNADLEDDAGDKSDYYWRLRTSLSSILAKVGQPAVDTLLRALQSENPQTRHYAAEALGEIGNKRAYEPILILLEKEQNNDDFSYISALGNLRDERAVPVLLSYLVPSDFQNRRWRVRLAAIALGKIGTDEAVEALIRVLEVESDSHGRYGAVEGLSHIKTPRAIEGLKLASQDVDEQVRAEAIKALNNKR